METGVRLKASVLYQLFEDTNYKLKDVRASKIAKPVEIGKLPYELKEIQNTEKRKELFIQIVLPLILEENNKILLGSKNIPTLKRRMDIISPSMAIAQAAKETGWGTSRSFR